MSLFPSDVISVFPNANPLGICVIALVSVPVKGQFYQPITKAGQTGKGEMLIQLEMGIGERSTTGALSANLASQIEVTIFIWYVTVRTMAARVKVTHLNLRRDNQMKWQRPAL